MQLHLLLKFSCFFFFFGCISQHTELPWLGIRPMPTAVELEVLTVVPPGKPPTSFFCMWISCFPNTICQKTVLSPLNDFGTLVKNHLLIYMRVYFWACFSLCLVYRRIFMPIPHSSYDYNKLWNQKVRVLQFCSFKIMLVLWSYLRFHDGHIDFFLYLGYREQSCNEHGVQIPLWDADFIFSGSIAKSWIIGSYDSSIFNFLRNLHTPYLHTVFHSDWINLTFPPAVQKCLLFSIPSPILLSVFLKKKKIYFTLEHSWLAVLC